MSRYDEELFKSDPSANTQQIQSRFGEFHSKLLTYGRRIWANIIFIFVKHDCTMSKYYVPYKF